MTAAPAVSPLCTLCGRPPSGVAKVSLRGELTCARHPTSVRCVLCSAPHDEQRPPGWRRFTSSTQRCVACQQGAIETQLDARTMLPPVRADMAAIGVVLQNRVLVRVVDPDELGASSSGTGVVLAEILQQMAPGQRRTPVEIHVAAGLTPTHFGSAVAHEIGHAWLSQEAGPPLDHAIEEGLCELFAHAWLKRARAPLGAEMRRQMRLNPDPVYGGGLRAVHSAVETNGIRAVLYSLTRTGALPGRAPAP